MNQMTRGVFGVAAFALLLATSASFAQQPPPVRIRGQIEKVEGDVLDIKLRNGDMVKVKLVDPARVMALVKASLDDVKVGNSSASPPCHRPTGARRPLRSKSSS